MKNICGCCIDLPSETRASAADLRDLKTQGKVKEVETKVHTLKGSASLLGIWKLSEICSKLESTFREEHEFDTDGIFTSFKEEVETICFGLLDFFENHHDIEIDGNTPHLKDSNPE